MIGIYDLDLWHGYKPMPNLELMQIYHYYYDMGETVMLLKPQESVLPFSHIFYFKEYESTPIPRKLWLYEDKKSIIGAGFYGKVPNLKPEISCLSPQYDVYDAYCYKFKLPKPYEKLKQSSLIRVESNNLADLTKRTIDIYIADTNFLYTKDALYFLKNTPHHNFFFFHGLNAKDEQTALNFLKYANIFNREILIDFRFGEEFFLDNVKEKFLFNCDKREDEDELNYLLRITKMALVYKNCGKYFRSVNLSTKPLAKEITTWARSSRRVSCYDFYANNERVLHHFDVLDNDIRLLLKANPLKIDINLIDLKSNL